MYQWCCNMYLWNSWAIFHWMENGHFTIHNYGVGVLFALPWKGGIYLSSLFWVWFFFKDQSRLKKSFASLSFVISFFLHLYSVKKKKKKSFSHVFRSLLFFWVHSEITTVDVDAVVSIRTQNLPRALNCWCLNTRLLTRVRMQGIHKTI